MGKPRAYTANSIRDNYTDRHVVAWTHAEAGEYIGVGASTIRKWQSQSINGKQRWATAFAVGPFNVDRFTFEKYARTGTPQGEPAKRN